MNKDFYVYAFYAEDYGIFYIGMGCKNRMTDHFHIKNYKASKHILFYRKLNKLLNKGTLIYYRKLKRNLTQEEAWNTEKILIQSIGRIVNKSGPLYNILEGGKGGIDSTKNNKKVGLYDIKTLKLLKIFESRQACAQYLNMNPNSISGAIIRKSITLNKYFIGDFDAFPVTIFKPRKRIIKTYDTIKIKVILTDINNNTRLYFNSVNETCLFLKVHKQTLRARMLDNKPLKGYLVQYDK